MVLAFACTLACLAAADQEPSIQTTHALDSACREVAARAVAKFSDKGLKPDQFALTVVTIDRSRRSQPCGSYRGTERFYPASVVKLFYLAHSAHLIAQKKLKPTEEFERAATDMIVDSCNDATALILDTITGTTGGPELPPKEFAQWAEKRNAVNRWYRSLGYDDTNTCQKTWNEGPYGRERQSVGKNYENRNSLTTRSTARLMVEIMLDRIVPKDQGEWMRQKLLRKTPADAKDADFQSRAFIGKSLPKGSKIWSKAGYTDDTRHDVAFVSMPDGRDYVLAVFTKNNSNTPDIIPFIAEEVWKEVWR